MATTNETVQQVKTLDNVLFKPFINWNKDPAQNTSSSTTQRPSTDAQIFGNQVGAQVGNLVAGQLSSVTRNFNPINILGNSMMNSERSGTRAAGMIVNSVGNSISTGVIKGIGSEVAKSVGTAIAEKGLTSLGKEGLATIGSNIGKGIGSGALNGLKSGISSMASPGAIAGLGLGIADAMLGAKSEYSGEKGNVTQSLDKAYGLAQTAVGFIPGIGQAIGLGMQAAKVTGKALGKIGGGTDAMTTGDAILGSDFFNWNIGALNGFGGARAHAYFSNNELNGQVQGGFGGFTAYDAQAQRFGSKKYGAISNGARKRANEVIDAARTQYNALSNIVDYNTINDLGAQGSTPFLANQYSNDLSGGIQQLRAAKHGMKINKENMFTIEQINKTRRLISEYKVGGFVTKYCKECSKVVKGDKGLKTFDERIGELDERLKKHKLARLDPNRNNNQNLLTTVTPETNWKAKSLEKRFNYNQNRDFDVNTKTPDELVEHYKLFEEANKLIENSNANFASRLQDPNRKAINLADGNWGNFKLSLASSDSGAIVYPEIQEIEGELKDLSEDRVNAQKSAIERKDYVYFPTRDLAEWFTTNYKKYYEGFDKQPESFKQGGKMNVIPEGALHARLNHLDQIDPNLAENITNKGIPVVTNEKDGEIVQHAEIEHSEIIYNLEVSNKLEELRKKDKENTNDDSYAIEAGKLIVEETLRNTDDRVGLINNIE